MDIHDQNRNKAYKKLPKFISQYIQTGANNNFVEINNRLALDKYFLKPKVMVDVSERNLSQSTLGMDYDLPIALAPIGFTGLVHGNGEIIACKEAYDKNIPFVLSTMSICSIEQIRKYARKPFWFQCYVFKDKNITNDLIKRAKLSNCPALVLTVDAPILGDRNFDYRSNGANLTKPLRYMLDLATNPQWLLSFYKSASKRLGNITKYKNGSIHEQVSWLQDQLEPCITEDLVKKIRDQWAGKLVIKGILSIEDAQKAIALGADAIIVSNHGGRQLGSARASIDVLYDIAQVTQGSIDLYVDGGFYSGVDIIKAIGLGAKMVFLGRSYLHSLAANGDQGLRMLLDHYEAEISTTLGLMGEDSLSNLSLDNLDFA